MFLVLTALLVGLCGCKTEAEIVPVPSTQNNVPVAPIDEEKEITQPEVVAPTLPEETVPPTTVPVLPENLPEATIVTEATMPPTETVPDEEEPSFEQGTVFQYGDTTPTWDENRVDGYPADEACTDEMLLEKWLHVEGLTLQDLENRNCFQLLMTVACPTDGVETINVCYEKQADGQWISIPELSRLPGHVGKNGIKHNRVINSYTSPAGLWALGMAFGNSPEPDGLMLPWRDVTNESDWVCDPASRYFNTWQERNDPTLTETWDYEEGEHLADYPRSYAYSCVIEFNTDPYTIPSRGCAIFLHCGESYTAGCVSLPERDLLKVLLWLDPSKNPYILITGTEM